MRSTRPLCSAISISWLREAATDPNGRPFFLPRTTSPHGLALPLRGTHLSISKILRRARHLGMCRRQSPLAHCKAASPIRERGFGRTDTFRLLALPSRDWSLLAALEAELSDLALWNSTYVFFSADHGYHFGELRLGGGKWNVYDTDIRVPMRIIGRDSGQHELGMVGSHVDLAPTWLELAGLEVLLTWTGALYCEGYSKMAQARGQFDFCAGTGAGITSPVGKMVVLAIGGAYIEYHGLGPTGATSPPSFASRTPSTTRIALVSLTAAQAAWQCSVRGIRYIQFHIDLHARILRY